MSEKAPLDYRRIDSARKIADAARPTRIGIGILLGMAATIVFLVAAFLTLAWGGGGYDVARPLFPYSMVLAGLTNSVGAPSWAMAIIQWPVYGALIGNWNAPWRGRVILILVVAHMCALVVAISVTRIF